VSGSASGGSPTDRSGHRYHRPGAAWQSGRPLLSRLLWALLLLAAVHLLRRSCAVRTPAAQQHRARGGKPEGSRARRSTDPAANQDSGEGIRKASEGGNGARGGGPANATEG